MRNEITLALLLGLAAASLAGCGGAESRKAQAMERGRQYLLEENYQKARVEFSNALQIDPTDADALYYAALAAERAGDLRQAARGYQAALDADVVHAQAAAALGRLYVFSGLVQQGLDLIEKVRPANPEHPDVRAVRAAALLALGRADEAQAEAAAVVASHPEHEHAVALLAGIHRNRGELDEAVALIERALERVPRSVDLRVALAQLYIDLDDREKAEAQLLEVVGLRSTDPAQRQRLALFYARAGELDAAEATLREVIELEPEAVAHKLALVEFLAARRSFDAAEAELLGFVRANHEDRPLRLALGEFYETHELPDDAERVYRELIAELGSDPTALAARNRLAAMHVRAGRHAEAEPLLEEVLAENPRDNDALILRASIALASNKVPEAIGDLRAVLRDQPDSAAVLRALARAHAQNNEPDLARDNYRRAVEVDPSGIETRIEFADYLGRRGEWDEASRLLDAVLASQPDNEAALQLRARVLLSAGDIEGAVEAANAIVEHHEESPVGHYLTGVAQEASGDVDAALASYERSLAQAPRGAEPLGALIRVLVTSGRRAQAKERLEQVLVDFPDHVVAMNLLAELVLAERDFERALALSEQAIAAQAAWWLPHRTKALALLAKGDVEAAYDAYREGLQATGNAVALGMDLAALYERDGRNEEAIALYETLLAANPTSEPIANNLAMLLATYRADDASYERARGLVRSFRHSDNPAYLNTYGWVSYRQQRFDEAVSYLRRAVSIRPDSPVMRYHLGMALLGTGRADQARVELEAAVQSEQPFPGRAEAEAALTNLTGSRG